MEVSGQLHALAMEGALVTHLFGYWVGPKASLAKKNVLVPALD
jgi:hypothetical protein